MANSRRMSKGRKIALWVIFSFFCIYSITLIFPFLWLIINSLRTKQEFFFYPLKIPSGKDITFGSYNRIFSEFNIASMYINSIILSLGGTFGSMFISAMCAYVVAKYNFKFRNVIYVLAIMIMLIPTTGSIASLYRFMNKSMLSGTHLGLIILYSGGLGFNFFLLYGFFKSVSWSYAEAAMIDGAGNFQVFYRIMLPQALPALFAVGIITFIGLWNDYFIPYLFLKQYPTLAVGIDKLATDITIGAGGMDYPALFAAMFLATLPIIIAFAVFQKTIISNTVVGGLKG